MLVIPALAGCANWNLSWPWRHQRAYAAPDDALPIGQPVDAPFARALDNMGAGASVVFSAPGAAPVALLLSEIYVSARNVACRSARPEKPGPVYVFCREPTGWRALPPVIDNSVGL